MNDRTMIGWAALIILSVVTLALIWDHRNTGELEVRIFLGSLMVRNVGRDTITITDMVANNRAECVPRMIYSDSDPNPNLNSAGQRAKLKVGEQAAYSISCNHLSRVEIKTDAGSFEYTFD
jgi:hypothetical protein